MSLYNEVQLNRRYNRIVYKDEDGEIELGAGCLVQSEIVEIDRNLGIIVEFVFLGLSHEPSDLTSYRDDEDGLWIVDFSDADGYDPNCLRFY